jgi:hypothetical protein
MHLNADLRASRSSMLQSKSQQEHEEYVIAG